jgi:hypothetical protein
MTPCQKLALEARFLSYIVRDESGCMVWTGGQSCGGKGREGRIARGGPYGSFWVDRALGSKRAHIVWAWLTGKLPEPRVPDGHHLHHTGCEGGTLCVSCTELTPEEDHRQIGHSRHAAARRRAKAKETALRARVKRRALREALRGAGSPA